MWIKVTYSCFTFFYIVSIKEERLLAAWCSQKNRERERARERESTDSSFSSWFFFLNSREFFFPSSENLCATRDLKMNSHGDINLDRMLCHPEQLGLQDQLIWIKLRWHVISIWNEIIFPVSQMWTLNTFFCLAVCDTVLHWLSSQKLPEKLVQK